MAEALNIIGCGHLGKTLAHLWHRAGCFRLQGVMTRSLASAQTAVQFIGAGSACESLPDMPKAKLWLLAVSDDKLVTCTQDLVASGLLRQDDGIFHCSGFHSSQLLTKLTPPTVKVASVHPIHSFAAPATSIHSFAGTYCAYEGEASLLDCLVPAFEKIGGRCLAIKAEHKAIYHAGPVFACNYMATLADAAFSCLRRAGMNDDIAAGILAPLMRQTLENVLQTSPAEALTGPVRRGDIDTVLSQYSALCTSDKTLGRLYNQLAQATANLARQAQPELTEHYDQIQQQMEMRL